MKVKRVNPKSSHHKYLYEMMDIYQRYCDTTSWCKWTKPLCCIPSAYTALCVNSISIKLEGKKRRWGWQKQGRLKTKLESQASKKQGFWFQDVKLIIRSSRILNACFRQQPENLSTTPSHSHLPRPVNIKFFTLIGLPHQLHHQPALFMKPHGFTETEHGFKSISLGNGEMG